MLFSQAGDHFVGELITTKVGIMVQGSSLAEGEGKFLITSVLDQYQSWGILTKTITRKIHKVERSVSVYS